MPARSGEHREDEVVAPGRNADTSAADVAPEATSRSDLEAGLATVAEIVGTVELERALGELGRSPADATAARDDPLLGASVVVIEAGDGTRVALAEPNTEGRLAASLARHDEGPVGRYAALATGESLDAFRKRATAAGVDLSRPAEGPFGPSVLVLGSPVTGPHLIVVEPVRYHRAP